MKLNILKNKKVLRKSFIYELYIIMVRRVNKIVLPHLKKSINAIGCGGNVLLTGRNGGPGAASSYASLDDYANTINMNPYTLQKTSGMGLGSISKRLQNLKATSVKPIKKSKNISFTL